ncbi:hypothetical protein IEO21_08493 [Rhodonia placenta]|uniref:Uncharacterized protein n=2 Tax=Rhodonia placenta TaxID=104341 RepID=A0A1X6N0N1_9APHY|nr:hypothetical protein POSPLADRAFT_1039907 [Postia placenta MAD-698-R-SB12]KAF9806871.1 hypothetical protein IEO21_08493 [Postia placenta]OSX62036.1 hypothetical protein POSPLADRAFT_1039907 [Postia placenta MAD-698-R-SB12]
MYGPQTREIFPYAIARSTGTECAPLIAALLAAQISLDEISDAEDYTPFTEYIKNRGRAGDDGKIRNGIIVWLYTTGLHGPYHETDDGGIEHHGVLLTIESGAKVEDIVARARAALRHGVISHEHIEGEALPLPAESDSEEE